MRPCLDWIWLLAAVTIVYTAAETDIILIILPFCSRFSTAPLDDGDTLTQAARWSLISKYTSLSTGNEWTLTPWINPFSPIQILSRCYPEGKGGGAWKTKIDMLIDNVYLTANLIGSWIRFWINYNVGRKHQVHFIPITPNAIILYSHESKSYFQGEQLQWTHRGV